MGMSPQGNGGLAFPLVSDEHICAASMNCRHFEFDFRMRAVKVPVWDGAALDFSFGSKTVTQHFSQSGIYRVTFGPDWNSVSQVDRVSDLLPDELYLSPISTGLARRTR
jgi:hypothetical protein